MGRAVLRGTRYRWLSFDGVVSWDVDVCCPRLWNLELGGGGWKGLGMSSSWMTSFGLADSIAARIGAWGGGGMR